MLLGLTETSQETKRVKIKKRISTATTVFVVTLFLPFVIYALFQFKLLNGKSLFDRNIQEPVAKVITGSGIGTAFLVSPTILLTARHVVENYKEGDEVDLIFEQSKNKYQTKAKIKFIAPSNIKASSSGVPMDYFMSDIAVLEVAAISEIDPLQLGESSSVVNLDEVILIGYPGGDYSISKGNINSDKFQGLDLFKLDAVSNPGNSGGPCILKLDNTVIGILVGGSGPGYQGENIALKMADVKKILKAAKIGL